jgi:hypothetical protein
MTMHPADQETAKAAFLDHLREAYGITTGTYTGLWQRYQQDLATKARDCWANGGSVALINNEGKVTCLASLQSHVRYGIQ